MGGTRTSQERTGPPPEPGRGVVNPQAPEEGPPETTEHGTSQAERALELIAQAEDRWRRAAADLENFRKRCARELGQARENERARVAAAWLPVVDNLELALRHADLDNPASLLEGVNVVYDQAVGVLAGLGYRRYGDSGGRFDPHKHEVVSTVHDEEREPGTIIDVVRPGYGDGTHQLRPASVVVARRSE
ncbi:MAG: molecular chaperone GrpE [Nocardioidaceae bacterium]|jgi:molecular chaperone GrpE|nr:molecular chaperone GrpE [Nocardioidaceae bacterium]